MEYINFVLMNLLTIAIGIIIKKCGISIFNYLRTSFVVRSITFFINLAIIIIVVLTVGDPNLRKLFYQKRITDYIS